MTYNIKVSSTFSKVVGFGAKPQGLVCRHKTQEGEEKQSSGLFFLGEPSSGVPPLRLEGRMAHVCDSRRGPEKDSCRIARG